MNEENFGINILPRWPIDKEHPDAVYLGRYDHDGHEADLFYIPSLHRVSIMRASYKATLRSTLYVAGNDTWQRDTWLGEATYRAIMLGLTTAPAKNT